MNEERLTIEKQLEEIKNCGNTFNSSQYYCLYKYDIERIIPYIEELQQELTDYKERNEKAIDTLYCWGEVLQPEFQKKMLEILKGENENI